MGDMRSRLKQLIKTSRKFFHSFAAGTYPIILLLAVNVDETPISSGYKGIGIFLILDPFATRIAFQIIKEFK